MPWAFVVHFEHFVRFVHFVGSVADDRGSLVLSLMTLAMLIVVFPWMKLE